MTRTFLPTHLLLVASAGFFFVADARPLSIGVDGCEALASIVYDEVTGARIGSCAGPRGGPLYSGENATVVCNHTMYSATAAFSSALRRLNILVTWGFHSGYNGDYCLGQSLSECYPTRDPAMPPLSREDLSFVRRSWEAVHDSIVARMSLHPGSDVSRFQVYELVRSIRRSIAGQPSRVRPVARRSMRYNGPECPP